MFQVGYRHGQAGYDDAADPQLVHLACQGLHRGAVGAADVQLPGDLHVLEHAVGQPGVEDICFGPAVEHEAELFAPEALALGHDLAVNDVEGQGAVAAVLQQPLAGEGRRFPAGHAPEVEQALFVVDHHFAALEQGKPDEPEDAEALGVLNIAQVHEVGPGGRVVELAQVEVLQPGLQDGASLAADTVVELAGMRGRQVAEVNEVEHQARRARIQDEVPRQRIGPSLHDDQVSGPDERDDGGERVVGGEGVIELESGQAVACRQQACRWHHASCRRHQAQEGVQEQYGKGGRQAVPVGNKLGKGRAMLFKGWMDGWPACLGNGSFLMADGKIADLRFLIFVLRPR